MKMFNHHRGKAGVEIEQSFNYLSGILRNTDKVRVQRRRMLTIVIVSILCVNVGEREILQQEDRSWPEVYKETKKGSLQILLKNCLKMLCT